MQGNITPVNSDTLKAISSNGDTYNMFSNSKDRRDQLQSNDKTDDELDDDHSGVVEDMKHMQQLKQ